MEHSELCLLYESGELSAEDARAFEGHLRACGECAERLKVLQQAHAWAREAAKDAPAGVRAVTLGNVREPEPWWPVLKPLGWSLALAGVAAALYLGKPDPALDWASGIDSSIERLQADLDAMQGELTLARMPDDFSAELEDMRRRSASVSDALEGL